MQSILFLMKYPLHKQENLKVKFDGQMAGARALGYDAYCVAWDERGLYLIGDGERTPLLRTPLARLPGYDHTLIFRDLFTAARRALALRAFDAVYLRYMPTFSNAPDTLRAFRQSGARLIVEHSTWPIAQEKNSSFFRSKVFNHCDRYMAAIHPTVDLYLMIGQDAGGSLNGRPAVNILNGVDPERYAAHQPRPDEDGVHLLALASMSAWHGYDRLLRALAAYDGDARVTVHMVGGDGDGSLANWRALADELALGERVIFHGPLYGQALDQVIGLCDVGVGSLGMYRFGYRSASTLKLREYMARGLPFVYAVDDVDFALADPAFCLRMSNDDSPIDMAEIVRFARAAKRDPDTPARMRAYAREHMSWAAQLREPLRRATAGEEGARA